MVDDLKRWSGDGWRCALVFEGHGPAKRASRGAARRRSRRSRIVHTGRTARRRRDRGHHRRLRARLHRRGGPARAAHRQRHQRRARDHPPGTCARCRAGGATRSTRWSCTPATSSCTSSTASAGTWSWCSARSTAPTASTWSSSTRRASAASPATGCSCRPTRSTSSPATSAGRTRPLHKMGGADWKNAKARARKAVREIAAQLIKLYAARQNSQGHAFGPDTPWQRELEDAFPYTETPGPALRYRGGQAGHGEADPDGPADLRRRRLRQDRDRGAGGVQGGAGRQAGGRARADHPARAAALQHVHRADEPVPDRHPAAVPVPDPEGVRGDAGARSARARRTSSSAPTGCCRRRPGSRTSD